MVEQKLGELEAALSKEAAERRAFQARVEPHLWVLEGAGALKESVEKVLRRGLEGALWFALLWLVSHTHIGG